MPRYVADPHLVRTVVTSPVHLLAFGGGVGLLPIAPGTWASLATAVIFWWLAPVPQLPLLLLVLGLFVAGVWICRESSRRLGVHDHQGIVLDEVVGMLLTLVVTPPQTLWIAASLLAFRAFDVLKPWPIRDMDHRLSGGLGIMLDDVLAAIYAALTVVLLQRLITVL